MLKILHEFYILEPQGIYRIATGYFFYIIKQFKKYANYLCIMKFFVYIVLLLLISCNNKDPLPILGTPIIKDGINEYPKIQKFKFISQDSAVITNSTFENKIYITDFIFLSCPTMCPTMTTEMKKVYEKFKDNSHVLYLSHTIDPERDHISLLKSYSNHLGADPKKWFFVTGNKDSIYAIAKNSYFINANIDKNAEGGFIHSGALLLIDKNKHIRGVYDAMQSTETDRLISDINTLLKEQF